MTKGNQHLSTEEIATILSSEAFRQRVAEINNNHIAILASVDRSSYKTLRRKQPSVLSALRANSEIKGDNAFVFGMLKMMDSAQYNLKRWLDVNTTARVFQYYRPLLESSRARFESVNAWEAVHFVDETLELIDRYCDRAHVNIQGRKSQRTIQLSTRPVANSTPVVGAEHLPNVSQTSLTIKSEELKNPPSKTASAADRRLRENKTLPANDSNSFAEKYGLFLAINLHNTNIAFDQMVEFIQDCLNAMKPHMSDLDVSEFTTASIKNIIKGKTIPSPQVHHAFSIICKVRDDRFNPEAFNELYNNARNSAQEQHRTAMHL